MAEGDRNYIVYQWILVVTLKFFKYSSDYSNIFYMIFSQRQNIKHFFNDKFKNN